MMSGEASKVPRCEMASSLKNVTIESTHPRSGGQAGARSHYVSSSPLNLGGIS